MQTQNGGGPGTQSHGQEAGAEASSRCIPPTPVRAGSQLSASHFQLLWVRPGDFFIKTLLPFNSSSL